MIRHTRANYATARHGIAAVTCALTYDTRQLERVLDDADCRHLAGTLAHWLAECLTHLAAHDCPDAPTVALRRAGVRYSEEGEQVA
jgi:hypothetical protein